MLGSYEIGFGMRNNGDKGGFEVYGNYVWHYAKIKDSTESRGGGDRGSSRAHDDDDSSCARLVQARSQSNTLSLSF